MKRQTLMLGAGVALILAGLGVGLRIPLFYLHYHLAGSRLTKEALAMTGNLNDDVSQAANRDATANTLTGGSTPPSQSSQTNVSRTASSQTQGQSPVQQTDGPVSLQATIPLALPDAHQLFGLLEIPKLKLEAPVVQGTDDTVLNSAIGHVADSVMPGEPGICVLAAHNATWFRHVDELKPGDTISVRTDKGTYTYEVTGHEIVQTGTQVQATAKQTLILESCYPLDALYLTKQRYLVYATLVRDGMTNGQDQSGLANRAPGSQTSNASGNTSDTGLESALGSVSATTLSVTVRAKVPADLQSEGLLLHENSLPLGTINYSGHPSASFTQSDIPLQVTNTMVQLFEAYLHANAEEKASDLNSLFDGRGQSDATNNAENPLFGVTKTAVTFAQPLSFELAVGRSDQLQTVTARTVVRVGHHTYQVLVSADAASTRPVAEASPGNPVTLWLRLANVTFQSE